MMKSLSGSYVFFGATVLLAALIGAVVINAAEQPKSIRIIYTNDTMGEIAPCG